jgi:hypothetical protein
MAKFMLEHTRYDDETNAEYMNCVVVKAASEDHFLIAFDEAVAIHKGLRNEYQFLQTELNAVKNNLARACTIPKNVMYARLMQIAYLMEFRGAVIDNRCFQFVLGGSGPEQVAIKVVPLSRWISDSIETHCFEKACVQISESEAKID